MQDPPSVNSQFQVKKNPGDAVGDVKLSVETCTLEGAATLQEKLHRLEE